MSNDDIQSVSSNLPSSYDFLLQAGLNLNKSKFDHCLYSLALGQRTNLKRLWLTLTGVDFAKYPGVINEINLEGFLIFSQM